MCIDHFPAHFRMLLLAVRYPLSEGDVEALRRLEVEKIDWHAFLAGVRCHRLGPLTLRGLRQAGVSTVPDFVLEALEAAKAENTRHALRTARETQRISRHFAAAGLALTSLKGVALSQTIFGDPCLRHCGDLDLLIEGTDLPRHVALMEELGYQRIEPACTLEGRRLAIYSRYWKDLSFRHTQNGGMVDLHWRLFNNRHHRANRLESQDRTAPGGLLGAQVRTLSREDQFLYCAAHGTADFWIYLKSLADLTAFLHILRPDELTAALQRADALGLRAQVSSAVRMAAEWMGASEDHPLLLRPDDSLHQSTRSRMLENLLTEGLTPRRQNPGALASMRLELDLTPGLKTLEEIVTRYLWRPRTWSIINLPDALLWLTPLVALLIPVRRRESPILARSA